MGEIPGVCFIYAKRTVQAAGVNSSGFTNEQSPQGGAFNRDLLDQKSKSQLFPGPGGGGLQMTSA